MILTVLILLPLVGALVTAFVPAAVARLVGLGFAAATLVAGIVAAVQYNAGDGMQLTETHTWIESLGVHYALGVDGLGLLMVLLTVVLVPIVLLAGWHESEAPGNNGAKAFFAWTLALEAMSLAVFTATDVLLFYVVFEATYLERLWRGRGGGLCACRPGHGHRRVGPQPGLDVWHYWPETDLRPGQPPRGHPAVVFPGSCGADDAHRDRQRPPAEHHCRV